MAAALLEPGTILSDRYRVDALLGEGGMGAVFRAEHVHMHKTFAVKVLHPDVASQAEVVARFEREAQAAGSIGHPNVASATDFGRLPNGSFFLVMEYVDGRSLRKELEGGKRIAPERALRILRGILAGIEAAHAKGIVHRDLKPENIMLVERDGERDFVKVLDFGVAKLDPIGTAGVNKPGELLTQSGAIIGTPEYMAPEQALGRPVDARTDLYALGVMFYEMLAGQTPFTGDAVALVRGHVLTEAPPLPDDVDVSPVLRDVIAKLLAKEPSDRYASAKELKIALAEVDGRAPSAVAFQGRLSSGALTPPPSQPALEENPRRKTAAIIGTAVGVLAIMGLVSALTRPPAQAQASATAPAESSEGALPLPPPPPPGSAASSFTPATVASAAPDEDDDDDDDDEEPAAAQPQAAQTPPPPTSTTAQPRPKKAPAASPTKGTARKSGKPSTKGPRKRRSSGRNENVFQKIGRGVENLFK